MKRDVCALCEAPVWRGSRECGTCGHPPGSPVDVDALRKSIDALWIHLALRAFVVAVVSLLAISFLKLLGCGVPMLLFLTALMGPLATLRVRRRALRRLQTPRAF